MQTIKIEAFNHGQLVGLFGCDENKLDTWMERIRDDSLGEFEAECDLADLDLGDFEEEEL